jgi:hypothetical protein
VELLGIGGDMGWMFLLGKLCDLANLAEDIMSQRTIYEVGKVSIPDSVYANYSSTKYVTFESLMQMPNPKSFTTRSSLQTPALLTSAPSPFTTASNLSTTLLLSLSRGLLSGLGISSVFDLLGLNGMGVEGLLDKNCI